MGRAGRMHAQDEAVTDVIGTILMVAITVGMMVGLSALVLGAQAPSQKTNADVTFLVGSGSDGWGTGDETVTLLHRGGESLPSKAARIAIAVNGTTTVYAGDDLDGGFSDGRFTLGDTWERSFTLDLSTSVDAILINTDHNQVAAQVQLITPATQNLVTAQYTYVDSHVTTTGTTSLFANAKAANDGLDATLQEETGPAGSAQATLDAAPISASNSVVNPSFARLSDNDRALLDNSGDWIDFSGFSVPAGATDITSVTIGIEALRSGGGGNAPDATVSYSIGGTPGATSQQFTIGSSQDAIQTFSVTGDRSWTVADVESMTIRFYRDSGTSGVKDIELDQLYVDVDYDSVASEDLQVDLHWSAVPGGIDNVVEIRYHTVGDTFRVEVFDGTSYSSRGSLTATSPTVFSYTLALDEYNGGNPRIRITDLDSGSQKGQVIIDYARVKTL